MAKWSDYLIGVRIVTLTSIAVTGLVLGIRQLGFLEALELKTFDQLMRQRPYEKPDPRLLVVTVTEEDIANQGNEYRRGSLSDRSLARLLATLESYKPRAIGLNIFRDFPVETKYPDLAKRLKESNRLFTICHVISGTDVPGIAPPPEVPKERQGFSDIVIDADGLIRRHLLAIAPDPQSPCQASYGLATLIALHYLKAEGISPKFTSKGELEVGTTVFNPLETHSGGYQQIDAGGYQVPLNYRATQNFVQQVTVSQVLNNQLNPHVVTDKVVLIGITAPSAKDYIDTPYGTMPGVIIHAQMVSQILSAVLDGRPLLWVWPWWGDVLWIWGWSLVSGTVVWLFRPRVSLGLAGGAAPITLYAICFFLLAIQGGWVPLIPSILTLSATGGAVAIGFTLYACPMLSRRIQENYRDNPATTQQTIESFITSAIYNHQQVAAQAIAGIAVDNLSRCQLLSDIADIADDLVWIPSPAPKQLGSVLPQLLDISQSVRASVEATSPYRKSELLNRPITALRQLLNSLTVEENAQLVAAFGNIAQRWLTILETAQRTLEEQAQYSKEIRQVYIAGNALDPQTAKNRFKGRIDLFREIERLALEEPPPVLLLYGGRRTGKTSTLKYLPHRVGVNLVPLLVDVQGAASATTLSGLAENLATQIIEAARRLPRRLDLPYPDKNKLAQDPFPALQDWLGELERTVPSKRFLLCLDEFERLSEVVEATGSRTPLNFLRNVLQHRAAWTLLFSGSHEPKELPDYWSDYLINTRTLRVSYLDEDSARELIVQPVEDFTNIYEPTAIDAIIHLTRCQPYLVQLTCYEVVELLNRDIRENRRDASTPKATAQDVETVVPTVLERGGEYFRELWKSLTESDRHLLRRLVQGETPTPQDKTVLRKLERKEILEKTESSYRFQVPLVQNYVEQVVEEEM